MLSANKQTSLNDHVLENLYFTVVKRVVGLYLVNVDMEHFISKKVTSTGRTDNSRPFTFVGIDYFVRL